MGEVASVLFGAEVSPSDVIGETLQRATPEENLNNPQFLAALKARVEEPGAISPTSYSAFVADPLSSWIEGTFGVFRDSESRRIRRRRPRCLTGNNGAASELSRTTGASEDRAKQAIEEALLAGYTCERNPSTGFPAFAFRLHQFISRGDTIYASLESEDQRYLTLNRQQFVPGDRKKILLPLVFCRECGQEYYCVRRVEDADSGAITYIPRELSDRSNDDDSRAGFLYYSSENSWPSGTEQELSKLPEDWIEDTNQGPRVKSARKKNLPRPITAGTDGKENVGGHAGRFRGEVHSGSAFICRVAYDFRTTSDFGKLTALGTEGRSTATTILSLATIRHLRKEATLDPRARKLLSFTDNRQDASLQAGHFNDFVEIGLLRSALLKACSANAGGLSHEVFTQKIFEALALPFASYSKDPDLKFQAKLQTERAFRDVIGYRLYHDLRRGWRVTSPNLEQCGLLEIDYLSLDELSNDGSSWQSLHPALAGATAETRFAVAKTLLDFMRRELAVQVDYLDATKQETIQQQSSQRLITPWALDENELLEHAATLYPRSTRQGDFGGDVFVTARSGFGLYLRRTGTFPQSNDRLSTTEVNEVIRQLLETLRLAGLVEIVDEAKSADEVHGYRLPASAILWIEGEGTKPFRDPIRVPGESEAGGRTNPFFVNFYQSLASELAGFEAREHTAQVPYEDRLVREDRFRKAELPVLYCSPTMELGVDIAELNVVNMRNVPPTPANYAQRSGRAGRSGQPALVFSYCTTGSPHDQYFFKRPDRMVSGEVTPPRLDLANEDLVRAHLHAIWLAEANLSLGSSLRDLPVMLRGMIRLWPQSLRYSTRYAVHSHAWQRKFARSAFWPPSKTISRTPTGIRRSGPKRSLSRLNSISRRLASAGGISAKRRWPNRRSRTPSLWTCPARRTNAARRSAFGGKPSRNTSC